MKTIDERVESYVDALERATRELGYATISVETLNRIVSRFIEKHNPPLAASDRALDRNILRQQFERSLKESFKPVPKQESYPTNVIHFPRKNQRV